MRPVVSILEADKHIKGLFLGGYLQNALLNGIDPLYLLLVKRFLICIRIFYRRLIVRVLQNQRVADAVTGGYPLACTVILLIIDAIPAEHHAPVSLRVLRVLLDDLLIFPKGLVKLVDLPKMVTAVEGIRSPLVGDRRKRYHGIAAITDADCLSFDGYNVSLAHFALQLCHNLISSRPIPAAAHSPPTSVQIQIFYTRHCYAYHKVWSLSLFRITYIVLKAAAFFNAFRKLITQPSTLFSPLSENAIDIAAPLIYTSIGFELIHKGAFP